MIDKISPNKTLYDALKHQGLTEYGSVIQGSLVQNILEIEYPSVGTRSLFEKLALLELNAISYVRELLLSEGKYIRADNGNYRILLPSENAEQINKYMSAADKKLNRAMKLYKNTPIVDTNTQDHQLQTRIFMKQESIKNIRPRAMQ